MRVVLLQALAVSMSEVPLDKLTLQQLHQLADVWPAAKSSNHWVAAAVLKMYPEQATIIQRWRFLDRVEQFCDSLPLEVGTCFTAEQHACCDVLTGPYDLLMSRLSTTHRSVPTLYRAAGCGCSCCKHACSWRRRPTLWRQRPSLTTPAAAATLSATHAAAPGVLRCPSSSEFHKPDPHDLRLPEIIA